MRNSRLLLAALFASAAVLVPTSGVHASEEITDTVHQLAADGAELVAEEHVLLGMAGPGSATPVADLPAIRAQLRSVDAQGVAVLDQLERLDIELTDAIRVALDRLPAPEANTAPGSGLRPPPSVVYEAALDDLLRIAATPEAVMTSADSSSGPAPGLLIVAAMSLVVLGFAALISSMRRRPIAADLEAMAWSDGLTGLANRRRLDHDLVGRGNGPTAVIMIDVDHFKLVNDKFGHHKGDEVLRTIGTMLANQIRHDDVVYRYGGEEFCILLPDSTSEIAQLVADRIVKAAHQITLPDGQNITVSIGVADSTREDVHAAIKSADHALYEAKDLGRDQAVTADQTDLVNA
jgi:diguanylate cyclase (GGDEF)-like protein